VATRRFAADEREQTRARHRDSARRCGVEALASKSGKPTKGFDEMRELTTASARARRVHRETKGWSPERRARQAHLIRNWRPWTRSTGPRTAAGKKVTAMNALKHGFRSRRVRNEFRAVRLALARCRQTAALAADYLKRLATSARPSLEGETKLSQTLTGTHGAPYVIEHVRRIRCYASEHEGALSV